MQTALLTGCCLLAYLARYDLKLAGLEDPSLKSNVLWWVGLQVITLQLFGLDRSRWRYVNIMDLVRLCAVTILSSIIVYVARMTWPDIGIPRGAIVIDCLLALLSLSMIRVATRVFYERRRIQGTEVRKRVLLIGAGDTGAEILKQIQTRPDAKLLPVGILDDNISLHGLRVHGVPVLGSTDHLQSIASEVEVSEILVCVSHGPASQRSHLLQKIVDAGLHARVLPDMTQFLEGRATLESFREVEITDLLGRDPVRIDTSAVSNLFGGKRVLVTGAGGSIGSELCRQILQLKPATLILVERAEPSLFLIEQQLLKAREKSEVLKDIAIHPCLADITDKARIDAILDSYKPEILCHAAAHKHVPLMEMNPGEAVKNNIFGTRCLAEAATEHNVGMFVMVSTDKAVNPSSMMGASKRAAEIFVQSLAHRSTSKTKFVTVRFGNVLGSSGSVVPIFREQIAAGGPITVTHPDMKRYFMLIPEAVQLILQAATYGSGGQIFVLDMGEPVRIVDMARQLIRLSGLRAEVDIQIRFTGLRPGEKLFEELQLDGESVQKTPHDRIRVVKAMKTDWDSLQTQLEELNAAVKTCEPATIRSSVQKIVPEYSPVLL